jgi:hypothetical protein
MALSAMLHSTVFILYVILLRQIMKINEDDLNSYIDNNCSGNPILIYSFQQILHEIQYYKNLTIFGLVLTILFALVYVFFMLCSHLIIFKDLSRKHVAEEKKHTLKERMLEEPRKYK